MKSQNSSQHYDKLSFFQEFSTMTDPRRITKGHIRHNLLDMIFLCIAAVVSGADDWVSIEEFGVDQEEWLKKFRPFTNGIPSHDTLGRTFALVDFEELNRCFIEWIKGLKKEFPKEIINIDGKRLRGSYDKYDSKAAIHMVSAFSASNQLTLGQIKTETKSNEITAIPKLLELLEIENTIITIDAMGCQKDIVQKIVAKKADYVIAVKENQKGLLEQVEKVFSMNSKENVDFDTIVDTGHGRIETRECSVINDLKFLDDSEEWKELNQIIRINSERVEKLGGKTSTETRYYITSLKLSAKEMNTIVRAHWSIENQLHWVFDVQYNEDYSRRRNGESAANFNILLKIANSKLQAKEDKKKRSINSKRFKSALSSKYREEVLGL